MLVLVLLADYSSAVDGDWSLTGHFLENNVCLPIACTILSGYWLVTMI